MLSYFHNSNNKKERERIHKPNDANRTEEYSPRLEIMKLHVTKRPMKIKSGREGFHKNYNQYIASKFAPRKYHSERVSVEFNVSGSGKREGTGRGG